MSKEMLKEADEWLYSMKCLLSVKTDEEDRAYTQKRIDLFNWLVEQASEKAIAQETIEILSESLKQSMDENKRYREAWKKAKTEAKEHGAGKADEDITDDGKEEAYMQGAQDMFDDFVDEYERALEGEPHD